MNRINTCGVGHVATKDRLLFVAEINHELHHAFAVFEHISDAADYIVSQREMFPELTIDDDFQLAPGLVRKYTECPKEKLFKGTNKQIYIKA